ncbi:hypothetical protein M440DRAFT_89170 [Trichoderma longibrachiatum ATCC 18648]|uniref:Uncharacterized protein n=1 Tax=Trichoderma longibrachiatum ATCC 18648 TaxID=983965 RepID=A0A2T4CJD4_TRILO|nr:hypothetical protein M440DRAFT_89170 [Trichoderma longibrachiatum ATCC 18648]
MTWFLERPRRFRQDDCPPLRHRTSSELAHCSSREPLVFSNVGDHLQKAPNSSLEGGRLRVYSGCGGYPSVPPSTAMGDAQDGQDTLSVEPSRKEPAIMDGWSRSCSPTQTPQSRWLSQEGF